MPKPKKKMTMQHRRTIIELRQHKMIENMKKDYRLIERLSKEFYKADTQFFDLPNEENEEILMEVAKTVKRRLEGLFEKREFTLEDLGVEGRKLYNDALTVVSNTRNIASI